MSLLSVVGVVVMSIWLSIAIVTNDGGWRWSSGVSLLIVMGCRVCRVCY